MRTEMGRIRLKMRTKVTRLVKIIVTVTTVLRMTNITGVRITRKIIMGTMMLHHI